MKKPLLCFVASSLFAATSAFAGPHTGAQQLSASNCDPGANKLVLNIVFQVSNDADSGVAGNYWASDSYTKHIQAWDMGNGTFCVRVKYSGSFVTVAGTSPGGADEVAAGITGTMEGGYSATITGNFSPGTRRTKGSIGSKDYACSIDSSGSASGCDPYAWTTDYFGGAPAVLGYWGWTYNAGDNGTWVNASTGNSGDITGS